MTAEERLHKQKRNIAGPFMIERTPEKRPLLLRMSDNGRGFDVDGIALRVSLNPALFEGGLIFSLCHFL